MQLGKHVSRVLEDVAVGVAAKLVTARPCLPLTATVLLPGVATVVKHVTVELHCQAVLRPAAVHPPAAGRPVRLGQWKSRVAKELQKGALELAEDDLDLPTQDRAELRRPGAVRPAVEDGVDLSRRCPVADSGLVARPRQGTL